MHVYPAVAMEWVAKRPFSKGMTGVFHLPGLKVVPQIRLHSVEEMMKLKAISLAPLRDDCHPKDEILDRPQESPLQSSLVLFESQQELAAF